MVESNILQGRQSNDSATSYLEIEQQQSAHPLTSLAPPKQIQLQDIVYGPITLPTYCWPFVNQPSMQRLKNILQLGPNYYVFPGATHNRFEHSCGTAYLCDMQMNAFRKMHETHQVSALSGEELPFSPEDQRCVVLAGLMHDLGHGIYSHLFDRNTMKYLLPNGPPVQTYNASAASKQSVGDSSVGLETLMEEVGAEQNRNTPATQQIPWEHEDASVMLIEHTYDKLGDQMDQIGITKNDIQLICELVKGDSERYKKKAPEKLFLFDIVANKRNSFDLDKLDYLNRDLIHTQINQSQINYSRIINNACIIDGKIAYNKKIYNEINMVYERRFELFRQVYLHKTCQGLDHMVSEALIAANPVYHFENIIKTPQDYLKYIHDDLLRIIQKSKRPELQTSANLLKRIETRDLYKCVGEAMVLKSNRNKIRVEDIVGCQNTALTANEGMQLRPEELIVHPFKLDWGNDDKYPLDNMHFFEYRDQPVLCQLPRHETSQYRPIQNIEYRIRVYVRNSAKTEIAKDAFATYTKKHGGFMHHMMTEINHSIQEEYKAKPTSNSATLGASKMSLVNNSSASKNDDIDMERVKSQQELPSKRRRVN